MINIEKQISFWRDGAGEDLEVARELILHKHLRHGLFFLHLALEKIIKAHVCKNINDLAPRIHNLIRLTQIASLDIEPDYFDLLAEMNAFNIEGRYPDSTLIPVFENEALDYLKRGEEVFAWLLSRLKL